MSEIQKEIERFSVNLEHLPPDTLLGQYIKYINGLVEIKDEKYLNDYLPVIEREQEKNAGKKPFLSVVTRTQGKRPEMLRETLLSLSAQTEEDFEVILIGHKLNETQRALVSQILSDMPQKLQDKIRFIELNYGNRTTPLNLGFSYAHGEYISILDDDDVVFDNWVEKFREAANKMPGRVLHAYTIAQRWQVVETDCGLLGLRASGEPSNTYCKDFEMIKQIELNVCPPVGLAFPAFAFQKMGIIFDETLDTTEDWDFLMRTAFIFGVTNIREPTCMYRLWTNAENSQTVHNQDIWQKNYAIIQEKIKSMPVILPAGEIKIHKIETVRTETVCATEQTPLRPAIKARIRKRIPKFIWVPLKKIYRFFGGKKWLG